MPFEKKKSHNQKVCVYLAFKGLKAGVLLTTKYQTNWLAVRTIILELLSQFDHLYGKSLPTCNGDHKSWLGLLMRAEFKFFLGTVHPNSTAWF